MLAGQGAVVAATDINGETAAETVRLIHDRDKSAMNFQMDVARPDEVARVAGRIQRELGPAEILVNNAGISLGGYFLDSTPEAWDRIISINLMGVVNCCRAFVPAMVESGVPAHIVNVSSLLGFTGARGVSAYCTTKFGVLGFSESLRAELAAEHIGVSAICPGMVRTNIIKNGILESSEVNIEEKNREIDEFYQKRNYPPERVAASILRAIRKNRAIVPVTPEAWAAYYLKRWFPGLVGWLARREWV
jgi:NAD(P)-dependent dehydrogenase (short-subunit alcohol dehydrogenase family)